MAGLVGMLAAVHKATDDEDDSEDSNPDSEKLEDIEDTEDAALDEAFRAVKQDDVASFKRSMGIYVDACYSRFEMERRDHDGKDEDY